MVLHQMGMVFTQHVLYQLLVLCEINQLFAGEHGRIGIAQFFHIARNRHNGVAVKIPDGTKQEPRRTEARR
ncbi:hypothetical protein DXN05_13125 [Deminuibacter soli]|uniref:Uncharacterized protein n=1 Tax=Deminuibacter soli TaxID=2291815 RepID=A0A3E1NIN6_9BACT|nr:hypothetical protein DXN05_13125 [Deminuibacter soli]